MEVINIIIKRNDKYVAESNLEERLAKKVSDKLTKVSIKKKKRQIKSMNEKSGLNRVKAKIIQGGGPGLGKKA